METTLNRQFAEAQRLLAKTERVERLMEQMRRLREAWERLDEAGNASIEDVPEWVIVERVFGERRRRRREPRGTINRTPRCAYRVPILEALEQLGGRGRVNGGRLEAVAVGKRYPLG
jgi:hypothetical protein